MMVVAFGFRHRFGDRKRAFGKIGNLENAERAVPQNCFRPRDLALEKRDRLRTDIEVLPAIGDSVVGRESTRSRALAAPALNLSAR